MIAPQNNLCLLILKSYIKKHLTFHKKHFTFHKKHFTFSDETYLQLLLKIFCLNAHKLLLLLLIHGQA